MNATSLSLTGGHHATKKKVPAAVACWHDEMSGHDGAYATCQEQPCLVVRTLDRNEG